MIRDFFDEDFPLTQKQEDELKAKREPIPETIEEPIPESAPAPTVEPIPASTCESMREPIHNEVDFFADDDETVIFSTPDPEVEPEPVPEPVLEEKSEEEPAPTQLEFDPIDHAPIIDIDGDGVNDVTYPAPFEPIPEEPADKEPVTEEPVIFTPIIEAEPEDEPEEYDPTIFEETPKEPAKESPEEEDDIDAELLALYARLDNIEKTVDAITAEPDDSCDDTPDEPFSYSYDERYFAEDETPAYKHPEIVKAKRTAKPAPKKTDKGDVTINVKTLAKVGAAVAGAVVAIKLLSGDSKK